MKLALNADLYAATRQNIFFPGVVPSLDGQCVSLEKWFLAEMSEVPNPQAARGNGNTCGRTLVNQGYAVEVPYGDRRRGDIICYEFGIYGHVAVQLSAGRVFESNVNLGGVASRIIDGERVYASRIGSESEAWRNGKNPHVYRLKTYNEGDVDMTPAERSQFVRGQLYAQMVKLSEGVIIMECMLPDGVHVWDLHAGALTGKYPSILRYNKGDKPEAMSFIDMNGTRYYIHTNDALNGKLYGINRKDIKIVGQYKPVAPGKAEAKLPLIKAETDKINAIIAG